MKDNAEEQRPVYRVTQSNGFMNYCGLDRAEARACWHRQVGFGNGPKMEIITDGGTDDFADDSIKETTP